MFRPPVQAKRRLFRIKAHLLCPAAGQTLVSVALLMLHCRYEHNRVVGIRVGSSKQESDLVMNLTEKHRNVQPQVTE